MSLLRNIPSPVAPPWVLTADGLPADLFFDFTLGLGWANGSVNNLSSLITVVRGSTGYGANYDGNLVSYANNTLRYNVISGVQGVLLEAGRTNLCLQSDDFTNASWIKTTMTTAKTATGPDGIANSASTLTATAGNAMALQTIVRSSAARITSCYIKRRTGSGTINITQDNGGTWTAVTVTSSWTQVATANATAANPIVGLRIVTNGDAVDVAFFQHEETSLSYTSPVRTTTVAVTRSLDNLSYTIPVQLQGTTEYTFFCDWGDKGDSSSTRVPYMLTTDSNNRAGLQSTNVTNSVVLSSGTDTDTATNQSNVVGRNKHAFNFNAAGGVAALNGVAAAAASGAITVPVGNMTSLSLGSNAAAAANMIYGNLYRVGIWKFRSTTPAVVSLTAQ